MAFIREYNLWVRDVASGKETQLTTDGVKDFSYALDNAGWEKSDRPILLWSPDSKKIATFQQDQRKVGDMYLVETKVGHPALQAWKYPLPGDDVHSHDPARHHRRGNAEGDPPANAARPAPVLAVRRRGLPGSPFEEAGNWTDVEWSPDSARLALRFHLARPQAGDAAGGRRRERRACGT